MKDFLRLRIGILGGGQLGKMLCQAGSRWGLDLHILDRSPDFPAGQVNPQFTPGDFRNVEDVLRFGRDKDVLTIEIEDVAVEALEQLQSAGVKVYPDPAVLQTIRDKGLQKIFYRDNGFPTAPFRLFAGKEEIREAVQEKRLHLPFVQKTRTAGYDGRGVAVINKEEDLAKLLDAPSVIEDLIPMLREISVVAARDVHGDVLTFPAVEMAFNPHANLVEELLCPASLSQEEEADARDLALRVCNAYGTVGLLAVEMFQLADGTFMVNEVAPRPHNSGHHTIECCDTSQYEQHLRAICGLPLGDTALRRPGVMLNILGAEGHSGPVRYEGWDQCLSVPGVFIHLYGKSETRPFRKMGHVTVTASTLSEAREKADFVRQTLKAVT
jgi:5-(carboxyamino)imidazole ribonucleotide synthase